MLTVTHVWLDTNPVVPNNNLFTDHYLVHWLAGGHILFTVNDNHDIKEEISTQKPYHLKKSG